MRIVCLYSVLIFREVANASNPNFYDDNSGDGADRRSEYSGDGNALKKLYSCFTFVARWFFFAFAFFFNSC
jgi:hypothetical protein